MQVFNQRLDCLIDWLIDRLADPRCWLGGILLLFFLWDNIRGLPPQLRGPTTIDLRIYRQVTIFEFPENRKYFKRRILRVLLEGKLKVLLACGLLEVRVGAILNHLYDLVGGNGYVHGVIHPAEDGTQALLAGWPENYLRVFLVFRCLTYYDIDGSRDLCEFNCKLVEVELTEGVGLPTLKIRVEVLLWDSQCEPFTLH